jgi:hypothetical protein
MATAWTLVGTRRQHLTARGGRTIRPLLAQTGAPGARSLRPVQKMPDKPENRPVVMDDERALKTLDVHYGMQLGCAATDLRRPRWTILTARVECDPMMLLFGQHPVLSILAPAPWPELSIARPGVAVVAPELRVPVATLLRELPPEALFAAHGLRALDHLLTTATNGRVTPLREAHTHVRYATPASFRPYLGQWSDWIEPLDEASESSPAALSLLARYSGGVYVIRRREGIASHAGIRARSPHVWEIDARTEPEALRGHKLGQAVVARATRAVFAAGRLPVLRHPAISEPAAHISDTLGYRRYADALTYFAPAS